MITPSRMSKKVKYEIRDIVDELRKRRKGMVAWLNIGDPTKFGFSPPKEFMEGIVEAIKENYKGYAPSKGDEELVEAVARRERAEADDVTITQGLSEGISIAYDAILNPGDGIALPRPTYPLYITKAETKGAKVKFYEENEYGVNLRSFEKAVKGSKMCVVINPNNPSGKVYPQKQLKEMARIAEENRCVIFYDGAYDRICFGERPDFHKAGAENYIYGSSVSKNLTYPGARVGWIVVKGPEMDGIRDAIRRISNSRLSINWEMQKGAAKALKVEKKHAYEFTKEIRKRAKAVGENLGKIGWTNPQGAFYTLLFVDNWKDDKKETLDFAVKHGILGVPNSGFGEKKPGMRIVLLAPEETLIKTLDLLNSK
ncbi:MAG: aminotransferase class I/II-fold pyridoxal phosphate-dependent enzyme [Candidatus Anstonellales archaeon]